jgi:hypothetical protein
VIEVKARVMHNLPHAPLPLDMGVVALAELGPLRSVSVPWCRTPEAMKVAVRKPHGPDPSLCHLIETTIMIA